jgi:hypothetical protein
MHGLFSNARITFRSQKSSLRCNPRPLDHHVEIETLLSSTVHERTTSGLASIFCAWFGPLFCWIHSHARRQFHCDFDSFFFVFHETPSVEGGASQALGAHQAAGAESVIN